jgi:hypothetical protein
MDDVPGDYTDARLQPPLPGVSMPTQQMGRLEVSRTRQQMGSGRRSATDDGIAGHGELDQDQVHARGRMQSWA